MKNVQLYDKSFKPYITYEEIQKAIDVVAEKINNDLKDEHTPIFLGVLTGSFMFFGDLMKRINLECETCFIRLASYEGTSSTGEVKQMLGLTQSVKDRNVVVVEDIVDTGGTIMELDRILRENGAKSVRIATLMFKPGSYKGSIKIDYPACSIPNDFIVGFGLDYDQIGRNLKDIYVLDPEETEKRKAINVR
ncbi:MAG: hypoxanthine phosphoribosyltransferase [Bacteroidales bacterium]|nr:hypoxanthine phosphoribosyltransferase [Bacteroidales bacterium]